MAMVRSSPTHELATLHSAMDRLFADLFGDAFRGAPTEERPPAETGPFHLPVNIVRTDAGYLIEAPVPGCDPDDVDITFSDGDLRIEARTALEPGAAEGRYLRHEVPMGSYRRQITLPGRVRADEITARFDNGLLRVDVPSAREPKPARIQIQPGAPAIGPARPSGRKRAQQPTARAKRTTTTARAPKATGARGAGSSRQR
jgi:HSP20 family protein